MNTIFEDYLTDALSLPFFGWDFSLLHDRWLDQYTSYGELVAHKHCILI